MNTAFFPADGALAFAAACENGHDAAWTQTYNETVTAGVFVVSCKECEAA